ALGADLLDARRPVGHVSRIGHADRVDAEGQAPGPLVVVRDLALDLRLQPRDELLGLFAVVARFGARLGLGRLVSHTGLLARPGEEAALQFLELAHPLLALRDRLAVAHPGARDQRRGRAALVPVATAFHV